MSTDLSIADYVVICVMLTISAGVGLYFRFTGGQQKTTQEYLMADKSMGVLPVTFSLMATTMSAIAILGAPAESYFYGAEIITGDFFFSLGILLAAYCFVPVYFDTGSNTVYDYLVKRFGKKIKIAASFLYGMQMILYMPVVAYAPSLALSTVTGLSLWSCVIILTSVCTFYSTLGGLKAVLWTDFLQAILMLFTVFLLIIKGSLDFGGFSKIIETSKNGGRLHVFNISFDPTVRYTLWNAMAFGTVMGLFYYAANFSLIQRLTSCGTFHKAKYSMLWNVLLIFVFKGAAGLLGLVIYSYYHDCDPIRDKTSRITSGDQLVPFFILNLFGHIPGLPGLCIVGILSAALSTMSSIVNSLSAITVEDYIKVYGKCKNYSESKTTCLAKVLAIFYGGLCFLLTFVLANVKGVLEASVTFLGIIAGPTLAVFILGMFTVTANEMGSLIGLFVGFILNAWVGFGSVFSGSKYPPLPLSTTGCIVQANSSFLETLYVTNSSTGLQISNATTAFGLNTSGERHIFPLYKVSFFWFTLFGCVNTVVTGYVASLIVGIWTKRKHVDPLQLSPVVRKWLSNSPKEEKNTKCIQLK